MEYYKTTDNRSKIYAGVTTFVVMALMVVGVSFINIVVVPTHEDLHDIEIEYLDEVAEEVRELPEPEPQREPTPPPPVQSVDRNLVAYEEPAPADTRAETSGDEPKTQTVNPNALFKPTAGTTPDNEVAHGNSLAPQGEAEQHKGEGTGNNVTGNVDFDGGLTRKDVLPGYPEPTGNNEVGKVAVKIEVDYLGKVTRAVIQQKGTTTSNSTLRKNALDAARNTRFKADSTSMRPRTGILTYTYKVR